MGNLSHFDAVSLLIASTFPIMQNSTVMPAFA